MLDKMIELALPQVMKDPELRAVINKVGQFVTTLDERLTRIEKKLGIEPAEVITLPPKDQHVSQNHPR